MYIILLQVMIILFGLFPIGAIIFYSFVLAKVLKSNTIKSDKKKKIFLLMPVPLISLVLLHNFSRIIRVDEWTQTILMFILSFPQQIALISSIDLALKLSKENTVIKDWFNKYKISCIATSIVAFLSLVWILMLVLNFVVYGIW